MKLALFISVAVNLLLAIIVGFSGGPAIRAWRDDVHSADATTLLAQMKACDIPPSAAKQVWAQHLLSEVETATPDEYWTPQLLRDSKRQLAQAAAAEQARNRIIQLEGDGAIDDPAYRHLFRPLDAEFPFLSSAKQLQLSRLRTEALTRRAEISERGGRPDELLQARKDFMDSLRQTLSAEELFEYQLRTSPAAQALLSNGFQYGEEEFRRVFAALMATAGPDLLTRGGVPLPKAAVSAAVRQELGEARSRDYERASGPTGSMAAPAHVNAVVGITYKE